MMNLSEIITALLEKYQSGDASNIDPSEYNIDRNKLLEIVEIMEKVILLQELQLSVLDEKIKLFLVGLRKHKLHCKELII